jgi:hypothetical protein
MRRALPFGGGTFLGLAAGTILWNAPDLYLFTDSWHSAALTRMVGLAILVEGTLAAFGAALCLGRAVVPLASAPRAGGEGPVLPVCGVLFLLASVGPFGQARRDAEALEVMDSMPGKWGPDLVADFRRHERTERIFGVLWLAVGGAQSATLLFLKPRVWQLGRRRNGVGWGIAAGGLLPSGMGAFVCYANSLAMEGANKDLSFAGYMGLLAGAFIAVVGSILAAAGRAKA